MRNNRFLHIAFINNLSMDNLALYDLSLLKGISYAEQDVEIHYFGNIRFEQSIPSGIRFFPLYRYCGLSFFHKGFSYLFSHLRLF
ncbi:MAG: hypothetical protein KAJ98_02400, partial [Spirochaetaceae bacterium]|nr:hypothetical protein [Spirochaetaceae bacterium]